MATGVRNDPYRGFNFRVELDNTSVAAFRECSGLTLNTDPVDYREGTDSWLSVRKLPGLRKYTNITLKRGFTDNQDLWQWYLNILNGVDDRRNGAIVLQDETHTDKLRWEFQNGWICKWEGATMNATSNDVAIETIEICHERLELS
ncbi:MAG: phage tail protein [Terracidiphilus sp.]|jgi:phage tail-like protein